MKRDQKQELLALSTEELQKRLRELQGTLIRARQERRLQDRTEVDVRAAYKTQQTIKMIKAEMSSREKEAAQATEEQV
ncbi:hypothetical protein LRY65_01020 [Candidatus Woesebacteria bacterium]|nr:hypothetical protein [Candidatus Woesebacteria bacterium]MCD8507637.1 hypothetical protein [Candidatus Woesebacteria bacterium]MCD8526777.1 hypothetical protein [Candidatus Woesebacteria bacterium]MCD8546477.1 hypothetical protein [Candidatus Woesebacteria bacterium]